MPEPPTSGGTPTTSVAPVAGTPARPTSPSRCQSPAGRVVLCTGDVPALRPESTPSVSIPIPATPRSTSSAAASPP